MKKQILKNIISNYAVTALGMVLGFFLIPFLIIKLGLVAYGLIVLAESTIGFFEIITVSIRLALARHATFSFAQGRGEDFEEYLSTGFVLLCFAMAIIGILGAVLSYYFSAIFNVPHEYTYQIRVLFFIIIMAFVFSLPNIVCWSVLYAKQRFDLINASSSIGWIFRAASIFVLFSILNKQYVSLITYGVIYFLTILIQNYIVYLWYKKIVPGIQIHVSKFNLSKVKEILSFGVYSSLSRVNTLIYENIVNFIINFFWGAGYIAIYAVSFKIPSLLKKFFQESSWALVPTFTDLLAKNDKDRFEKLFFFYSKVVSIFVIPLSMVLIFMAKPIMNLWVGPRFDLAAQIMPIHILPLLIALPMAVTGCLMTAYAKVKIPSFVGFIAAIFGIILGVLLAKKFALGLFGIAIGSSISTFFYSTLFSAYYSCKISRISLTKYWVESILKPFLWSLVIIGGSFELVNVFYFYRTDILRNFLIVGVTPIIYFIGSYRFLLNEEEKRHFIDFLGPLLIRLNVS